MPARSVRMRARRGVASSAGRCMRRRASLSYLSARMRRPSATQYARSQEVAMTDEGAPSSKARRLLLSILGTIAATLVVNVALQVDDWGRDLTMNHVRSDEGVGDPALRPIHDKMRSVDELITLVH